MDGGTESLTGKETNMTHTIYLYAVKPSESRTASALFSLDKSPDVALLVPMFGLRSGDEIVAVFKLDADERGRFFFENASTDKPRLALRDYAGEGTIEIEQLLRETIGGADGRRFPPVRLTHAAKPAQAIDGGLPE